MNGKQPPLLGLITLLAMASAARQGGLTGGVPTLDEMLAGGRQKGVKPEAFSIRDFLAGIPTEDLPDQIKADMKRDILDGTLKPTPDCECEFCSWIVKQPEFTRPNEPAPDAGERHAQEYGGEGVAVQQETVPGILREAAATYEQRNPLYGDAYKHYGSAMMAFFPQGLYINEPEDWNRFGLFSMMVSKMTRIANNITVGGHRDSSLDLSVYAAMMTELTEIK